MIKIGNLEIGGFPLILAPMEDVTDPPFRALCKEHGSDLMFTEFISVEGLIRDAVKSVQKLDIYPQERPIGVQIFGANLDSMLKATEIVNAAKPEILDINYGCPVKKVVSKGAGAGILQDPDKMVKLTAEIVKRSKLPVTVKTRLGWNEESKHIVEIAERLQDVGIQGISIHGRTRKQMYKGEADWSLIGDVKNNSRMKIPVFGNGDIDGPEKAFLYKNRYGVDGIMIGRAAIGNPWIFREIKHYFKTGDILPIATLDEKINAAKQHLQHSIQWKGERLGILEMRRHYTNYFKGLPHIKPFRLKLVTTDNLSQLLAIFDKIATNYR